MKIIISTTILITLLLPYGVRIVHAETSSVNVAENRIVSGPNFIHILRDRNKNRIIKILKENKESNDEDENINDNTSEDIDSKKFLKKEIRRRKRLHKSLLDLYNKNFETKYFDLIQSNALRIEKLKKSYYTS